MAKYCAHCGKELGKRYVKCLDNFLQVKYFDDPDGNDNAFCDVFCFCASLSAEEVDNDEAGAGEVVEQEDDEAGNMDYPKQKNGCNCASETDEFHGWECSITGGECCISSLMRLLAQSGLVKDHWLNIFLKRRTGRISTNESRNEKPIVRGASIHMASYHGFDCMVEAVWPARMEGGCLHHHS